VHVQLAPLVAYAAMMGLDVETESRDVLATFLGAASLDQSAVAGRHIVTGEPADAILALARREPADALVVGVRGLSAPERLVFGSTTERILRRAGMSVFVVPERWGPPGESSDLSGMGPVIVGIDFTPASREAMVAGAELASRLDTSVVLLHVVEPANVLERWRSVADVADRERRADAQRLLDGLAASISRDRPVQSEVQTGPPARVLAEAADRYPRGLLVLGRARRGNGGTPPGVVASRTLARAAVPVLMHVAVP
jgi:nucleotide-binding universal stress UspA family protein